MTQSERNLSLDSLKGLPLNKSLHEMYVTHTHKWMCDHTHTTGVHTCRSKHTAVIPIHQEMPKHLDLRGNLQQTGQSWRERSLLEALAKAEFQAKSQHATG